MVVGDKSVLSFSMVTTSLNRMQGHRPDMSIEDTRWGWDFALNEWRLNIAKTSPWIIVVETQRLRMTSGDFKEDRLTTSAQSTPCGTPSVTPSVTPSASPRASPSVTRRSWFNLSPGSAPFLNVPEVTGANPPLDMGGNEGGGSERWSLFGTRSMVQKSPTDPGCENSTGFSLQSYFGLQKSSTMETINTQVNLKVEDPANFMPPKKGMEAKTAPTRPHKLKPRDLNVLTPSGF